MTAARRGAALAIAMVLVSWDGRPARADVQVWTEAGVEKRLQKKLDLVLSAELRFDQDVSRVESVLPEAWLLYRLQRWLRVGAGYRLSFTRDGAGDMVMRHRLMVATQLRHEIADVRVAYTTRYELEFRPTANDDIRHRLRNKLAVSYRRWKDWTPGVAAEVFHPIDGSIYWDKTRVTFGLGYTRKDYEIEVFYRIEVFHADMTLPSNHIIGAGFRYEL